MVCTGIALTKRSEKEMMDKYGVIVDEEQQKIASNEGRPCPKCGSGRVDYKSTTPHCPNCGTEPWEPNAKRKEEGR